MKTMTDRIRVYTHNKKIEEKVNKKGKNTKNKKQKEKK